MVYVLRFSRRIHADIERGYTGYMGSFCATRAGVLEETAGIQPNDAGYVYDPTSGGYIGYHHSGLACFALKAANFTSALNEAHKLIEDIDPSAFYLGDQTIGRVELIAELAPGAWLLSCHATRPETEEPEPIPFELLDEDEPQPLEDDQPEQPASNDGGLPPHLLAGLFNDED